MLTCKEASALVSQSLDRRLSWRERVLLRLHLWACDACSAFKRQVDFLRNAVRRGTGRAGELIGLSSQARERIRERLRRE